MDALNAIKAAVFVILGVTLGWVAASFYASVVSIPAAYENGVQDERATWEDAQREAEAKRELERRAAQARIDAIERDYHEREASRLAQLSALEAAIRQETDHVPPSVHPACRPAVPRSLRDALNPVGRATIGDHPAIPPPPMR